MFKSRGTIRVQLKADGGLEKIFFTPNEDSTVRAGEKQYAVFISDSDSGNSLVKKLPGSGTGVEITGGSKCCGLVAAAVQNTLVEIKVEIKNESSSDLSLATISIPAPSRRM